VAGKGLPLGTHVELSAISDQRSALSLSDNDVLICLISVPRRKAAITRFADRFETTGESSTAAALG
jgi:hypothetical protein